MKRALPATLAAALLLSCAAAVHAEPAPAADAMSAGEVRKVDQGAGKITIRHGPLKNLGMDAMTMVFRVQDPAMLGQIKAGDRIAFLAEKPNGQLFVTRLQKLN